MAMLQIDGKHGEGGGQILRTSLTLSALTGKPFRIYDIRAKRRNPGIQNQHLQSVLAAAKTCRAKCEGASIGSMELTFAPGEISGGEFSFDIKSAGSASLVLQTILPILFRAQEPSQVTIYGGTHNPWGPPYEFIRDSFLPTIAKMGFKAEVILIKHGFYPIGGGELRALIEPVNLSETQPLDLVKRGEVVSTRAKVILSNLPLHIAERERSVISKEIGIPENDVETEMVPDPVGPGNAVIISAECEGHTNVFVAFGQRGRKAEAVAKDACYEYKAWLSSNAVACPHLTDQLLIYAFLAGDGRFTTNKITQHFQTNTDIIKRFIDVELSVQKEKEDRFRVSVME
jgi:RNA 3'-terminal phosphate cyclase (ATP)